VIKSFKITNKNSVTRYFFHIAYRGTSYRGWQRQPNVRSVQEILEKYLARTLKKEGISIIGCGRTDAGVHASQFIFHFDLESLPERLLYKLNKQLPHDIVIIEIKAVDKKRHARFGATQRTYDYFWHHTKDPFLVGLSSHCDYSTPLDLTKMKAAIQYMAKQSDFQAFCKSPDKHNTTICRIDSIRFFQDESGQHFRIQIKANRFLRGMIRILVHKVLEIGEGYRTLEQLTTAFETNKAHEKLKSAPADGLYLSGIEYPNLQLNHQTIFPIFSLNWKEIK
jgi:tRNA pseudouridine38-40 synthase